MIHLGKTVYFITFESKILRPSGQVRRVVCFMLMVYHRVYIESPWRCRDWLRPRFLVTRRGDQCWVHVTDLSKCSQCTSSPGKRDHNAQFAVSQKLDHREALVDVLASKIEEQRWLLIWIRSHGVDIVTSLLNVGRCWTADENRWNCLLQRRRTTCNIAPRLRGMLLLLRCQLSAILSLHLSSVLFLFLSKLGWLLGKTSDHSPSNFGCSAKTVRALVWSSWTQPRSEPRL